jgi:hypothetical protein
MRGSSPQPSAVTGSALKNGYTVDVPFLELFVLSPVTCLFQTQPWSEFMGWLSRFFEAKDSSKVKNPAVAFAKPLDVVKDSTLSKTEKAEALDTWEQDARQLMTASNEGMPGPQEGLDPDDHHNMGQVLRAKEKIGRTPNYKPAH